MEGTLIFEIDEQPPATLKAGESVRVFAQPPRRYMSATRPYHDQQDLCITL
jgi:hypothetical protein